MRMFAAVSAILCGLLFSQAPEFTQQYAQRLGGIVDELDNIVRHFDEDSARSGYDRAAALNVMSKNSERLVRDQSVRMKETIARLDRLRRQQAVMKEGGSLARVSAFVSNIDGPLAERTWQNFAPALPLSFDGLMFGLIGFLISYVAIFVILTIGLRGMRRAEA